MMSHDGDVDASEQAGQRAAYAVRIEKPDDRDDGDDGDNDHPHCRTELDLLVGLVFPLPVRR